MVETVLIKNLRSLIEDQNTNPKRLSKSAGLNENAVADILNEKSKNPRHDTLTKLSKALGVSVDQLYSEDSAFEYAASELPQSPYTFSDTTGAKIPVAAKQANTVRSEDLLPVYASAHGGGFGMVIDNNYVVERVVRPVYLDGVNGAFAVYVVGDSMHPAVRAGDLIFVRPGPPPKEGDDVLVEIQGENGEHEALVKVYKRQTADKLILNQYNPPLEDPITLDRKSVISVTKIAGLARG